MSDESKIKQEGKDNSAEWLRSFKGCEHYCDDEALEVIKSIDALAIILLENAAQKLRVNNITVNIDNQGQTERIAA
jgi:hypothetical protein